MHKKKSFSQINPVIITNLISTMMLCLITKKILMTDLNHIFNHKKLLKDITDQKLKILIPIFINHPHSTYLKTFISRPK